MNTIETKVVRTQTTKRIELTREDIFKLLQLNEPPNCAVYMMVPGGGDWSNTSLDVGKDNPVVLQWVEVTEE